MLKLSNKFILAPIKLGYSDGQGHVTSKHLDFYDQRSHYMGAVSPEPLYMDPGLRELPTQMGIDDDDKIPGLKKLVDLIHSHDARVIAHLNHPGRMANPKIPGNYFWSSTEQACNNGGAKPVRMNRDMMRQVSELFSRSAKRAVNAGFDIIELQFGHGYLLAQFLSPAVNDRDDHYGGDFESRIRFPLEVLRAVRRSVKVPVIARISGDEMIPDGFHVDEMIAFSEKLEQNGIDAIHVTAGSACSTPPWFFQHMFIPKGKTWELAAVIKDRVLVPVIFVGRINSFKDITYLEEHYRPEYIALGRAMVADPDFTGKYFEKVKGILRPCLACAEGCLGGVKQGLGLGCVVNPQVNTGYPPLQKSTDPRKFAVVGGGLAGMQTAITLKERGHRVEIFEKNRLGGQFNLAYLPPKKESLKEIVDYYILKLRELKIRVHRKEATAEDLEKGGYDGVVMATGAIPIVPKIKGLEQYYWTEFLEDEHLPENEKILVIGGGLIGLEMASKLIEGKNRVIVVEMLDEIARGMEMIEKAMTVKRLKDHQVEIYTGHTVTEIRGETVVIQGEEGTKELSGVTKIVVATGMKSYLPFDPPENLPVYRIGDALKVGKAQEAIHQAYELGLKL